MKYLHQLLISVTFLETSVQIGCELRKGLNLFIAQILTDCCSAYQADISIGQLLTLIRQSHYFNERNWTHIILLSPRNRQPHIPNLNSIRYGSIRIYKLSRNIYSGPRIYYVCDDEQYHNLYKPWYRTCIKKLDTMFDLISHEIILAEVMKMRI